METIIVLKVSFRIFARSKKCEVKEKLLAKSAEMFLNLGVKSVTMDEIAAEMGISKKTIYAHFPTKTKLIEATALYVFENISCGIDKIREENKDPLEELYIIKNFALDNLKDEKSSPQYQLQKYYPKIFTTIKTRQQKMMRELILENLQKGIDQGLYRADLPLDFTTRIYFVGMLGIKDRDFFPEKDYTTSELVEKHLEYHLRAIVTEKGMRKLNELLNSTLQK